MKTITLTKEEVELLRNVVKDTARDYQTQMEFEMTEAAGVLWNIWVKLD